MKSTGMTALVFALLILTALLRLVEIKDPLINSMRFLLVFAIYIGMLTAWTLSIRRRMMHSHIRGYLLGIAALMLLWILFRTSRHGPYNSIDYISRPLWYAFYISMVLIPLLSFFAALCLGKPEAWRPSRNYNLFFIPAGVLILGILTNDCHHLAFTFAPGHANWSSNYSYNILFFLAAIWIICFFLATVWLLFKKSYIPHTKKRVWMPLAVIGIAIIYAILYGIDNAKTGFGFIEMTAMYCASIVGIWESCIQTGLLPSNTKYGAFFDASPLAAQIVGQGGLVHYSSILSEPVSAEEFERLKEAGALHPDADTALYASPIRGGYVVWREDVSQLSRLIEQLRYIGEELQGGVALLKDEIDTKSRQLHIDEQNRLYDLTLQQTMPQLMKIKRNLYAAPQAAEENRLRLLWEINLLGTYIKRRGNLVLMAEGREAVTIEELARCFYESIDSLQAGGARCVLSMRAAGVMNPIHAVLFYDLFETAAEAILPSVRSLFITLFDYKDALKLSLEMESDAEQAALPNAHWRKDEIAALGGILACEAESEDMFHISLRLQKGGGAL